MGIDPLKSISRSQRLLRRLEVDRAVFFGLLTRLVTLAASPISALLIATRFTPELQGYHYTFVTLLALQAFIELGLGTVIQQFASHEWAKLRLDPNGGISGSPDALSRLSSIARIGVAWFGAGSILLSIGLAIGGLRFFGTSPGGHVGWRSPWLALSVVTGIVLFLQPALSILEGCNQVRKVYAFRFVQTLISVAVGWASILLGARLWTAPIVSVGALICTVYFLATRYRRFLTTLLFTAPPGPVISWSQDMLPMHWRIAITWISGYFCFSLFTPVLFKYHGAAVAGQMGMTWSLVGVIAAVATSWLSPRIPQFAILAAGRRYGDLDHLFWRITIIVILVAVAAAVGIVAVVLWINAASLPIARKLAARLLPPLPVALFAAGQVLLVAATPFASYLRAHKQEPLMYLSVTQAAMVGVSTVVLGKHFSGLGIAVGYVASNAILMPMVFLIWYRRRRSWVRAATLLQGQEAGIPPA